MRNNYVFYFDNNKYEAIGNILGLNNRLKAIDYNVVALSTDYNMFYKTARKNHASCDVYRINDSDDYYILCGSPKGKFFKVNDLTHLKLCEDYKRWYQ